jgi:G:T-mismatch repair DNA endonuclease (very short patch repair protein)
MRKRRKFKPKISKLELEIGEVIRSLRFKFSSQYKIYNKKRCVGIFDFYLARHKLAIEVNGTYWHSDPRVYKKPVYRKQKIVARRWKNKLAHAKKQGITVLVIWELDWKAADNKREFLRRAIKDVINAD